MGRREQTACRENVLSFLGMWVVVVVVVVVVDWYKVGLTAAHSKLEPRAFFAEASPEAGHWRAERHSAFPVHRANQTTRRPTTALPLKQLQAPHLNHTPAAFLDNIAWFHTRPSKALHSHKARGVIFLLLRC